MTKREEELIDFYVSVSEKARKEGLLSLEDDIASYPTNLSRVGIQLIIDGNDPEHVEQIIDNCIAKDSESLDFPWKRPASDPFLKMEKTALLGIQSGMNPGLVKKMMLSILGTRAVLQDMKIDYVNTERNKFFELIHLEDLSIQRVLRDVNNRLLAEALSNVDDKVRSKVTKNMSKNAVKMLYEEIEAINCDENCSATAQTSMGRTISLLLESGEIISSLDTESTEDKDGR